MYTACHICGFKSAYPCIHMVRIVPGDRELLTHVQYPERDREPRYEDIVICHNCATQIEAAHQDACFYAKRKRQPAVGTPTLPR